MPEHRSDAGRGDEAGDQSGRQGAAGAGPPTRENSCVSGWGRVRVNSSKALAARIRKTAAMTIPTAGCPRSIRTVAGQAEEHSQAVKVMMIPAA